MSERSAPGRPEPLVLLIGGPAGAGKTTLARGWAARQARAAVVELDTVRSFILGGGVDPQIISDEQERQYRVSVRACGALARSLYDDGYSVALEEVFVRHTFESLWLPLLAGLRWKILVVRPTLETTLARSRQRTKRVLEKHTAEHHTLTADWPPDHQLDTSGQSEAVSLSRLEEALADLRFGL